MHLRAHYTLPVPEIALAVALSITLGQVRLLQLPLGGSVTLATLPLVVLALTAGFRAAVAAGAVAGVGHAAFGGVVVHPAQYLLDYLLAWAALALVAVFVRMGAGARTSIMLAELAHLPVFVASGTIYFAQYAGTHNVFWYSLVYNAAHVLPEALLVALLAPRALQAWARTRPPTAIPLAS